MNRREAIAALVALPAVTRISVAALAADDVLVVETDYRLSMDQAERIKAAMGQVWPGRKVAVFDGGMRLKVVSSQLVKGAAK